MFRVFAKKSLCTVRCSGNSKKQMSSSFLEADAGGLATRAHHTMTTSLAVLSPIYFLTPDSMTDGIANKIFGVALSVNIAAHSWIGMSYVVTDYVPKFSKKLVGPARIANAGVAALTVLGMSYISCASPGGIKGCVKGIWNGKPKEDIRTSF
jgi:succinate dehydrogenase hydrophobic anchor subunit